MAAQGVERQQATGQLVVLVMVGLGDQAQPRPQIALHLGACAFLPAGSLARWLAGTCGLCGGRRSCVAQHACQVRLEAPQLRAARRKVPAVATTVAVAQQRAGAERTTRTYYYVCRIIARPAQSARSQQDGGRAGGWAKVPLLDARVGGARWA